jgi:CDP-glucose 4,6-dehydratase
VVAVTLAARLAPYEGAHVLVTGHTGFKGTWLSAWLISLGAEVTGLSLPAAGDTTNILSATTIPDAMTEVSGDIRDMDAVASCFHDHRPELVIHMAAQSLVRPSYLDPIGTIATNVIGTAHVLEASRRTKSVRAIVAVASDKCYENPDDGEPHSEEDALGGADPYSASKGASEIITASYRKSFFDTGGPLLASVRAGNVLGAGDASQDRIVPDIVRMIDAGGPIVLRNPSSVRPWQHVLEPLRAYLILGADLLRGDRTRTGPWNIGPSPDGAVTVADLARRIVDAWGIDTEIVSSEESGPPEAKYLRLNTTKARDELGFAPSFEIADTIDYVVDGYRSQLAGGPLESVVRRQISAYSELP